MLVYGILYPIIDAYIHGESLTEGLWVSFIILPSIGIMVFIVALIFDKSILFEDDEDEGSIIELEVCNDKETNY
jgi:hypothetical protein